MDPATIGALIGASATLLSGLFGQQAAREEKQKDRQFALEVEGIKTQGQVGQTYPQTQQRAFESMMANYGRILGG
jgi:hypothetical protein